MSPLARSLLALAALLAAADTDAQSYDCVTKIIGQVTNYVQPLSPQDLPYGHSDFKLDNYCPLPMHLVGANITVCNKTPKHPRPEIQVAGVDCYDPSGCTADPILEYCGY